jgi:hypothetical protein
MRQFMVPQFIEVEDKILGPITVRQFIFMIAGGVIVFLAFRFADLALFIVISLLTLFIVFLFGFFKVNGAPFHEFILHLIEAAKKPSLRVWNNELTDAEIKEYLKPQEIRETQEEQVRKEMVSSSRLAEISLIVDTRGKYKGQEDEK